jgi:hypothetical protein
MIADKVSVTMWFAAAAMLLAALLVGAEQQQSNPRAGWPCGGRLDPSYFQVAEGSGGHLLLLAPEEIGDAATLLTAFEQHPQTIFRLAGSVSRGLHEFQVPIDPSVESVLFSISVQCLQAAEVVAPSGAPVGGDGGTDLFDFRAQRMVVVRRPHPGVWNLRVQGTGVSAVVVQAKSAMGIAQIEFATAERSTFSPVPSAGVENTLRIRMSGRPTELRASLVSGVFQRLAALPLTALDTEGSYVSRFTPGAEGFRIVIAGKGADGFPFQRMHAPLFTPAIR